ncbi:MAG: gamma-glutamylcyclotransferase [Burkholderiales bacterium]
MTLDEFMAELPKGDLWVFGYGSLMWSPGFSYSQKGRGRIHGYHRALCILSTRYRGTKRKPGLVMGLCRGGSCWGMAYRLHGDEVRRALARLWKREMPRRVYAPRLLQVQIAGGRQIRALAFLADPTHPAYVRELDLHGRARLVAQGIGQRGTAVDYIRNTLEHMHQLGVNDPHLERILHAAIALRANGSGKAGSGKAGSGKAGSGAAARAEVPAPRRQPEATAARDVLQRRASGRAPRRGARAASRN